jgi:uncharacterized protein YdeI (YjbR/CyaY-like superfamily)
MCTKDIETFYPQDQQQWRAWLQVNHAKKRSIWLICYKKKAGKPTISWSDAVDEALCFGWIDSTRKTLDEERFIQFFGRRKAVSTWSKVNKEKVSRLIEEGKMTEAGLERIAIAKENGSWNILDEVEDLIIPDDLEAAFRNETGARDFFLSLSKSDRKIILSWLVFAKRAETRQKRIREVAERAGQGLKPKALGG